MLPIPPPTPAKTINRRSFSGSLRRSARKRSKAGTDLGDGSLSSGRSARANGQSRSHGLDNWHSAPDPGPVMVVCTDDFIGPVPLGLGRESKDEPASTQPSQRREHEEEPMTLLQTGEDLRRALDTFSRQGDTRSARIEEVLEVVYRGCEGDRTKPRYRPDERAEEEPVPDPGYPGDRPYCAQVFL